MKRTLEIENEFDFSLLGISCHAKDHRLSWEINRSLDIKLKKEDDYYPESGQEGLGFAFSGYYDQSDHLQYTLISNHQDGRHLIVEYPQLDYFFKVNGAMHEIEIGYLKQKIQIIEVVLTVLLIDVKTLKSKPILAF